MWPEVLQPYLDMYDGDYRRTVRRVYNKRNTNIVHQETCPCCGRKLVNLYPGDSEKFETVGNDVVRKTVKEWKCKKCWDKEGVEING